MESVSVLSLAYYGDAVLELLVREHLINSGDFPPGELVMRSKQFVTCEAQSDGAERIRGILTEKELDIFKRGRNAKSRSTPRHGVVIQYRRSTGFEALFGYLYLNNKKERAATLFQIAFGLSDKDRREREGNPAD